MDEEDLYDDYDLDEDEDDEDDDFIDDSESNIDASKYIRKIFGYDRRKYVRMLVVLLRPWLVESSVIVPFFSCLWTFFLKQKQLIINNYRVTLLNNHVKTYNDQTFN